jgi:hypothetical protein
MAANDDLLASMHSGWADWRKLDPEWLKSEAAEKHRDAIAAILAQEYADEQMFFVKDPRICRYAPFFAAILSDLKVTPVAVVIVRNPLEVAHSLRRRDGIPPAQSLLLWLRHILDAEHASRDFPRCILPYEGFLENWKFHIDRVAQNTGVVWPISSNTAAEQIETFLTADLRHQRFDPDDLANDPVVMPMVREVYEILTQLAVTDRADSLLKRLDEMRMRFDEGCETFGGLAAERELAVDRPAPHHRASSAEELQATIAERDELLRHRDGLIASVEELTRARQDLEAQLDRRAEELRTTVAGREELISHRDSLLANVEALKGARHKLAIQRDRVIRERDEFSEKLRAVTSSRSWRLTKPLRDLSRLVHRTQR